MLSLSIKAATAASSRNGILSRSKIDQCIIGQARQGRAQHRPRCHLQPRLPSYLRSTSCTPRRPKCVTATKLRLSCNTAVGLGLNRDVDANMQSRTSRPTSRSFEACEMAGTRLRQLGFARSRISRITIPKSQEPRFQIGTKWRVYLTYDFAYCFSNYAIALKALHRACAPAKS